MSPVRPPPPPPIPPGDHPLALVCHRLSDDLSGLALARWPLAAPGPREVRIGVRAAALNFPDLLMTRGGYQFKPPLPFVPGMEGAGVVLHAGDDSGWAPGARVGFAAKQGALATETVLPGDALHALPDGLDFDTAAAAWVTGLTAWVALARIGRLQRGETLLVHGARGGVGQACVQLGLHLGARLIATASQPALLADLAAQGVRVLPADDFRDAVLSATGGRGADLIADPVGGAVFDQSQRCIAFGGRVLVLGFASGSHPTLAINRLLIKGYSVVGVRAGELGRQFPQQAQEHRAAVQRLIADGVIRPRIGARFALARAVQALQALADRQVVGKIVVTMDAHAGA
jgi:NADPH:quinone reductase